MIKIYQELSTFFSRAWQTLHSGLSELNRLISRVAQDSLPTFHAQANLGQQAGFSASRYRGGIPEPTWAPGLATGTDPWNASQWRPHSSTSVHPVFTNPPAQLRRHLAELNRYPRMRKVFDELQREGKIQVVCEDNPAEASWQSSARRLIIDPQLCEDNLMESILFELGNARNSSRLLALSERAQEGSMSCDEYISEMERIEMDSGRWRSQIIDEALVNGALSEFSLERPRTLPGTFKTCYFMQQLLGHSSSYVKQFKRVSGQAGARYSGTIPSDLSSVERQEMEDLLPVAWKVSRCGADKRRKALAKLGDRAYQAVEASYLRDKALSAGAKRRATCYYQMLSDRDYEAAVSNAQLDHFYD